MIGKLANRVVWLAAGLAAPGLVACGGSGEGPPAAKAPDYRAALAGAPKPLAKLYAQGDRLLPGGPDAFRVQLDGLRGHPTRRSRGSWARPPDFPRPLSTTRVASASSSRRAQYGSQADLAADIWRYAIGS